MRIKFLRRVQYESEGRAKGPVFDKDSEHDFPDAFAQRWLRRGVAVVAPAGEPPKSPSKSEPAKKAEDEPAKSEPATEAPVRPSRGR